MAVLLQIKEAYKSYGEQVLLDGAEATLTDDAKVGFIGRNGAARARCSASFWEKKNSTTAKSFAIPVCGSAICGSTIRSYRARARTSS